MDILGPLRFLESHNFGKDRLGCRKVELTFVRLSGNDLTELGRTGMVIQSRQGNMGNCDLFSFGVH